MNVKNDTVWAAVDNKGNAYGGYKNPLKLCGSKAGAKRAGGRSKHLKVVEFKLVEVMKEY